MKTVFETGDRVYDFTKGLGWGTIKQIILSNIDYRIMVSFDNGELVSYTLDGKIYENDPHPTLSFTEYNLTTGGFSQERPEMPPEILPEKGSIVWVRDEEHHVWKIAYFVRKLKNATLPYECSDYINLRVVNYYKFMITENPYKND